MLNVYLDLDGVMTNFDGAVESLVNMPTKEFFAELGMKNAWARLAEVDHLFLHLEPLPNYKTLFSHLLRLHNSGSINLEILTSLPLPHGKLATAKADKIAWVKSNLDNDIKVNTVIGGSKKAKYVKDPSDILIDDLPRNISAWEAAGGTGILFKNNAETILKLAKII
jgi:5'(3')-deoxyribonucleotidase